MDLKMVEDKIYFSGNINADTSRHLINALKSNTYSPIYLYLTTDGGSVASCLKIIDVMDSLEHPVYTFVDKYVGGAGVLILINSVKRFITLGSTVYVQTNVDNVLTSCETGADELSGLLKKYYVDKTRLPKYILNSPVIYHLSSKQCLEYGLVDEIVEVK